MLAWFARHRIASAVCTVLYYWAVVLLHEEVSKISVWIENKLTRPVYNDLITGVAALALVAACGFIAWRIRGGDGRVRKILSLLTGVTLAAVAYNTLLVMNLEVVHFFQYGLLSIPVYGLTRRFFDSAVWVTLLGVVDEAYQYFWLYRAGERDYLDFNDMVLNLLGGGLGLILISVLSRRISPGKPASWAFGSALRSRAARGLAGVIALGALLSLAGVVTAYAEAHATPLIVLRRTPEASFWVSFPWGKTYHNLLPLEGVGLTLLLLLPFPLLDCAPPAD